VEHGEHGGSAAAPIAGRILRAYFDGKKPVQKTTSNPKATEDEVEDDSQSSTIKPPASGDAAND